MCSLTTLYDVFPTWVSGNIRTLLFFMLLELANRLGQYGLMFTWNLCPRTSVVSKRNVTLSHVPSAMELRKRVCCMFNRFKSESRVCEGRLIVFNH